ncbi:MAG: hypothetical protein ACREEB_08300 [Caulobacteraceae bacterium]
MGKFNVEDAAFAGVGLLARRPGSAIVWAVLWAVLLALVTIPFAGILTQFVTLAVQSGGRPDPAALLAIIPGLGAFWLLATLCSLVVGAVISCAVYRAILDPDDSAFAYLRLGDQEIQVLLVNFVRALVIFGVNLGLSIVVAIVALMATTAGPAAGAMVNLLGRLIIIAVMIWVQLRLILAGPMTFTEHRFRLFESWSLTGGSVWRLFLVGLIVVLIAFVVYLALGTLGVFVGMSLPHPADLQSVLRQSPSLWMGQMASFIALIGVLVLIGAAILTPIGLAPWAHAYRAMTGAPDDTAATFS